MTYAIAIGSLIGAIPAVFLLYALAGVAWTAARALAARRRRRPKE